MNDNLTAEEIYEKTVEEKSLGKGNNGMYGDTSQTQQQSVKPTSSQQENSATGNSSDYGLYVLLSILFFGIIVVSLLIFYGKKLISFHSKSNN